MKTIDTYMTLKNAYPEMKKCFFAFSRQQFDLGMKSAGISQDEKVYHFGAGLYGTKEGVNQYLAGVNANYEQISKECDPQEIYDYEFANHECGYVGNDKEAIEWVVEIFGKDVARKVTRRYGYTKI